MIKNKALEIFSSVTDSGDHNFDVYCYVDTQAFKDAATERRVQLSRKFKHPEYYDIPKPQPGSPYSSSNGSWF